MLRKVFRCTTTKPNRICRLGLITLLAPVPLIAGTSYGIAQDGDQETKTTEEKPTKDEYVREEFLKLIREQKVSDAAALVDAALAKDPLNVDLLRDNVTMISASMRSDRQGAADRAAAQLKKFVDAARLACSPWPQAIAWKRSSNWKRRERNCKERHLPIRL
ncbi:MAG: hypothetical protein MUC43_00285 [Pirellula sp.]|nr:hypothetical protein [Pirellula sp.]